MFKETFTIGRYEITITNTDFTILKSGVHFFQEEVKKAKNKFYSCFERNKPSYTVASVCLEYALEKAN